MEEKLVSIIVPVYNAGPYIRETIGSVLAQIYQDWELILVDDGSNDDTLEIIENIIKENPERRIRLVSTPENAGAAQARNLGLSLAQGRYIAFLDADDVWYPDKLSKQLQYQNKHQAGFTYTAYAFGDERAKPTGKVVRVPKTLNYQEALTRTIIFTSTVVLDRKKVGEVRMPQIASEDTATWWQILQKGEVAYGLDQPLVIYRRPEKSLSSNKLSALERIWQLYRKIAGLSVPQSAFCFLSWAVKATVRRVVDDTVRSHFEALKRFTVLQLSLLGLLIHTAVYGFFWFQTLYPLLHAKRFSVKGYHLGRGLTLYFRGHILILVIYFLLLLFLSFNSGGLRTGLYRPASIFGGELVALLVTNLITYLQLSLMRNWLLSPRCFLKIFAIQLVLAWAWSYLSYWLYTLVFPPKETLVVDLSGEESERIVKKFEGRNDRFQVMNVMSGATMEEMKRESIRWYGCVVICGGTEGQRRELMEYCYRRFIRVYLVPKIGDLLIQGMDKPDLFDVPILELKEYTIRWELRIAKRMMDILVSGLALLFGTPLWLWRWIRGEKTNATMCLGKNKQPFLRYGAGLRNVLNGTMSLVGPAPVEENEARERLKRDEWFFYRYRIKPGMTGLAQISRQKDTSEEDQLKMDLYYIQHYRFLLDLQILMQALRPEMDLRRRRLEESSHKSQEEEREGEEK